MTVTESSPVRGRRIEWFSAAEGVELGASGAMSPPDLDPEVLSGPGFVSLLHGNIARVVFREDGRDDGFSLVQAWFGENFPLPRHSHNGDCMYYVLRGEIKMGRQVGKAGDGLMVPAGTPYSYRAGEGGAEVLEFRTTSTFDMQVRDQDPSVWEEYRALGLRMRDTWKAQQPEWATPLILEYIDMIGQDPDVL